MPDEAEIGRLAAKLLCALDGQYQIEPFASAAGLSLEDAYLLTARLRSMREARGERVIGRKIGFTNRTIWEEYKVYAPIWGYMYDTTASNLIGNAGKALLNMAFEPKIEPEIAFHFVRAPRADMDDEELLNCVDWIAHGIEIVQSIYPGWIFSAADTVAGFGLHGAYFFGTRQTLEAGRDRWIGMLSSFLIELKCNGEVAAIGKGSDVLGSPLSALRHFLGVLEGDRWNEAIQAGEAVTTGTLTRAVPVSPGERWSTEFQGLPLKGVEIAFAA